MAVEKSPFDSLSEEEKKSFLEFQLGVISHHHDTVRVFGNTLVTSFFVVTAGAFASILALTASEFGILLINNNYTAYLIALISFGIGFLCSFLLQLSIIIHSNSKVRAHKEYLRDLLTTQTKEIHWLGESVSSQRGALEPVAQILLFILFTTTSTGFAAVFSALTGN